MMYIGNGISPLSLRRKVVAAGGGGGIDANTGLVMNMDAEPYADASITNNKGNATDSSVTLDTTNKVFGAASSSYTAAAYLSYASDSDYNMFASATQDYTIDFRLRHTTGGGSGSEWYCGQGAAAENRWALWHYDSVGEGLRLFVITSSSVIIAINTTTQINDNDFHHLALIKVTDGGSTVLYGLYLDGTQIGYTSDTSTGTIAETLIIGARSDDLANTGFVGNIDEFRIQKSNYFNASPNVGLSDTITVPLAPYST